MKKSILAAVLISSVGLGAQTAPDGGYRSLPPAVADRYFNPKTLLTEKETNTLLTRIVLTREPFLGSWSEKQDRNTLGFFFSHQEYAQLRGNPALGYTSVGSFTWPDQIRDVEILPFRSVTKEAQCIKPGAWIKAAEIVCGRMGLRQVKGAPIKVSGVLVGVNRTPPLGVYLEVRVQGPTGNLLYRGGIGKATLGDAVGASLQYILVYAKSIGDGRPVPRAEVEALMKKIAAGNK
jgi:hypothetical protein